MSVDLLIDGYNVMHFAGIARQNYGPQGFERARYRLLKRFQKGLSTEELARTVVVFDGTNSPYKDRKVAQQFGMEIIFSPQGLEADDVIEQMIAKHSSPKQLVVISSDNRLLKAARRRRAGCVDSESFLEELDHREEAARDERKHGKPKREMKATDALSETEIDEWLDLFEDVDPLKITQEVKQEELKPSTPTTPTQREKKPRESFGTPPEQKTQPKTDRQDEEWEETDSVLPDDPLINDVSFWQQRIDEMYREEGM